MLGTNGMILIGRNYCTTSQQLKLEAISGLQNLCFAKVTSPLHEEVPRQEGQQKRLTEYLFGSMKDSKRMISDTQI